MSNKFICDTGKKLLERCSQDVTGKYESKEECQKDCFTDDEKIAGEKISKKTYLLNLSKHNIKKIEPIKDIPLLTYDGTIYNKPIFSYDELRFLYININDWFNKNKYYENLLKSKNVIRGKEIWIKKEYGNKYTRSNFESLIEELKYMIEKKIKFCDKGIDYQLTDYFGKGSGHAIGLLIKLEKKEDIYEITYFIYEPNASTYYKNEIKLIEKELTDFTIANISNSKVNFINLSNYYGIQQNEISIIHTTINAEKYIKLLDKNSEYIEQILKKFIIKFLEDDFKKKEIQDLLDYTKDLEDEVNLEKMYNYINENYLKFNKNYPIIIDRIKSSLSNFFELFYDKEKKRIRISDEKIKNNLYVDLTLYSFSKKIESLFENINNHFKISFNNTIDVFNKFCFAWSKYVTLLIIMNENVDPFDIIKQAYFQTNNEREINYIFSTINNKNYNMDSPIDKYEINIPEKIEEFNNKLEHKYLDIILNKYIENFDFFYSGKLDEANESILKDNSYSELKQEFKVTKQKIKLYYKISNFIILLLLPDIYNGLNCVDTNILEYPLLAFDIEKRKLEFDNYKETLKIEDIFERLSKFGILIDGKNYLIKDLFNEGKLDMLTNAITNSIYTYEDINNMIISGLPQTAGGIDYKEKYLKYKQKYLQLKNKL